MNLFRLVLCVAGLAMYLLARQAVNTPSPHPPPQTGHAVFPLKSVDATNSAVPAAILATSSELAAQKQK